MTIGETKQGNYHHDRQWADEYLPEVKRIVGPFLLDNAPLHEDVRECTDLIVLRARDMRIGVRLRRPGYAGKYPGQFTIRSLRESGTPTELRKLVDGWGDWFFYGHTAEKKIVEWVLIDLHKLRGEWIRHPHLLHKPNNMASGERSNRDGTYFRWFDIKYLPSIVIAAHP